MAFTEKVSLSGTALSLLLYECSNTLGQEGFLLGDISSEITNHISDTQSDNARLETELVIRNVVPLPSIGQFYLPTGQIKEDVLDEYLGGVMKEVVGWYKFRKINSVKPTIRDKIVTRCLQKYFEKRFDKKMFVCCNITCKESSSKSTHSFVYKFGKFNCFDVYEHVEDFSPNLGEKTAGYRRDHRRSPQGVFSKIIKESNIQNQSDAILRIHEAVDKTLKLESVAAVKTENTIRELENEIKEMMLIIEEEKENRLMEAAEKIEKEMYLKREREMAIELAKAVNEAKSKCFMYNDYLGGKMAESDEEVDIESEDDQKEVRRLKIDSPPLNGLPVLNYSAALKKSVFNEKPEEETQDLIDFSNDPSPPPPRTARSNYVKQEDSSPEY